MYRLLAGMLVAILFSAAAIAQEADDPELIFKKTTVWRLLSPNAKLATYAIDDPVVDGVACHFTVPEVGGWVGWAGFAEERSERLQRQRAMLDALERDDLPAAT